jgi:predicted aspartyl protease
MNTTRFLRILPNAALVITAVLMGGGGLCAAGAPTLRPYLGETAAEFEARKNGQVFRSPESQDAVTIPADRYGHFQLQITIGGQPIRMRVKLVTAGTIAMEDVDALVLPPKRLGVSLLGMSFLNRLGGFEITNQVLTLRP